MFKSRTKFLTIMACLSFLLACGTFVFCLDRQQLDGSVNIQYTASKDFLTYKLNTAQNGWVVTGFSENKREGRTAIEIPNEHIQDGKSLPVTEVGSSAFYSKSIFTSVKIGDNVTTIALYAFGGCTGLTNLAIGNKVTIINASAFSNCTSLTHLSIPSSVTTIDTNAFYNCKGIKGDLIIPDSVTRLGNGAFQSCAGIENVIIGSGLKTMGNDVFDDCSSLKTVTINFGITYIGSHAFADCTQLIDVQMPESIIDIYSYAFYRCSALKRINIPTSVVNIKVDAFCGTGLTSVTIPAAVNFIDAFFNCEKLNEVIIDSPTIYKAVSSEYDSNGSLTYYIKTGGTIKILQTIDDNSNTYLNDRANFTKSTTTIDGKSYNVYTKK